MADQSGKSEQPTQRRLQKAREEGQYPSAREFVAALQFILFLAMLSLGGPAWLAHFRESMRALLALAFAREIGATDVVHIARQLFWLHFLPLMLGGLGVALATLGFRLITTRFGLSLKKLAPDPGRLNPLSRLRELSRQNLPAVVQAMVLLPVFIWAVYAVVRDKLEAFLALPLGPVESGCAFMAASLMSLFWKAAGLFLAFGALDLIRHMRRHQQDLRMSKQEIKEELKETEGNPQMRARIRRLQRDRLRRRMMSEVPKATAVVVNPTHYAVAIRYEIETMAAPLVIAKGKNYLAQRIRQIAIEHQIPIVENAPLAQALYKSVEIGQEIPPHLYRAVAEVLAYILKLMKAKI